MPLDGFTLSYLTREIRAALVGGRVDRVLQPERDEVHLVVRTVGATHRLLLSASANHARAQLTQLGKQNPAEAPMFCMLLRKHLLGGRVADVRQIEGDRVLHVVVDNIDELGDPVTFTLACEFMGRHSNVILVAPDGTIADAVRRVNAEMSSVREVLPGLPYQAPPAQDKLGPSALAPETLREALGRRAEKLMSKALAESVTGLSAAAAGEWAARALYPAADMPVNAVPDLRAVCDELCRFAAAPPKAAPQIVQPPDGGVPVDFLPFAYLTREGPWMQAMPTLSAAMEAFYARRDLQERMAQKTQSLHRTVRTALDRSERKLQLQLEQLQASEQMDAFRLQGDLLVAHQHAVPRGVSRVSLQNYFDENLQDIVIPLDEALTPMQNAQRYYKKYQKARAAKTLAAEQAEQSRADIAYLEAQLQSLSTCTDEREIDEIRQDLVKEGFLRHTHNRKAPKNPPPTKPAAFRSADGIAVEVGKTGQQNDRLTASADGEDLWLHAKDMPGSHVIVRLGGAPVPEATLRQAANLAAVYSKGSASANVPIDYTLRKYVRKPGGAKAGFVVYTHQSTLYVTPDEAAARAMEVTK